MAVITPRPAQPTPGSGPPELGAFDALVADLHHVFEFEVLDASLLGCEAEDGVLGLGVKNKAGRVLPSDRSRR